MGYNSRSNYFYIDKSFRVVVAFHLKFSSSNFLVSCVTHLFRGGMLLRGASSTHPVCHPTMIRRLNPGLVRTFATNFKQRPGPPPLDREAQQEFEKLQKEALASDAPHPEVRKVYADFEGDVNPETGEVGGPKQDPLRHGDYSFNGRVTDF